MDTTRLFRFEVPIPSIDGESVAEIVHVDAPVVWDEELNQYLLTPQGQQLIEDTKARYMGLLLPSELVELRKRLGGLSQKEIGDLLQIGEKSWSRWESGKHRPSRSFNLFLRALFDREIGVDYLKRANETADSWRKTVCHSFEDPERRFIRMDAAVPPREAARKDENCSPANQELARAA